MLRAKLLGAADNEIVEKTETERNEFIFLKDGNKVLTASVSFSFGISATPKNRPTV
jgi:hypothetical protein